MLVASLLLASLDPPMLGMSQAKLPPYWVVLAVTICRCSPKLSHRSTCTTRYLIFSFHTTSCSSCTERISYLWPAKSRSFDEPFTGLCYPTNALLTIESHWSSAPGFRRLQRWTRQMRHPRSRSCSFQQVVSCVENRHIWHFTRVVSPRTPEGRHMSSLLFFERPFVAFVYHPPVAQIVV